MQSFWPQRFYLMHTLAENVILIKADDGMQIYSNVSLNHAVSADSKTARAFSAIDRL